MVVLLACLSVLLTFGGGAIAIYGAAMIRQESGAALIQAGATAFCAGLLLAGLAAVLKELRRMRQLMELEELVPAPHVLPHQPVVPAPRPAAAPAAAPPAPIESSTPATEQPPGLPAARQTEEPATRPPDDAAPAVGKAPHRGPRAAAELPGKPAGDVLLAPSPVTPSPVTPAPADSAPAVPASAGPPSGELPASRFPRPPGGPRFPTAPAGGLPAAARASLAGYAGLARARPQGARERVEPAVAEKPPVSADPGEPVGLKGALDPAAGADAEPPAPATAPGAESKEAAGERAMLTSYTSGDVTYFMYSDGSIEAEMADGRRRFSAVEELRSFAETGRGGVLVEPPGQAMAQAAKA